MLKDAERKIIEESLGKLSLNAIARNLGISPRHLKREMRELKIHPKGRPGIIPDKPYQPFSISGRNRPAVFLSCCLVFVLVFLVYANTLGSDFIWDDEYLITHNSQIKSFSHIASVFKTYIGFGSENVNNFYRPLQELSNMVDYFLWANDPFGFHLTNVILHSLAAALVCVFVFYICGNLFIASLTAILFGVHPLNTEAVAYVAGRADPLFSVFFLASLILLVRYVNHLVKARARPSLLLFSIVLFACSILSKEVSLVYPLLVILYIVVIVKGAVKQAVFEKIKYLWIPSLAVVLVYAYVRFQVLNFFVKLPPPMFARIPLFNRLLTFATTIPEYIGLLIAPVGLHMERVIPIVLTPFQPMVLLAALVIGGIIAGTVFLHRRGNRLAVFFIGWFFVNLVPVSNIFPINSFIAEHWLYMACVGYFFMISSAIYLIYEKAKGNMYLKVSLAVLALVIAAVYSKVTIDRNKDWKDEPSFFESTLKYSPNNARLYLNFGNTYYEKGELNKAIEKYRKAIELDEKLADAYGNIGGVNITLRNFPEAEKYLMKAIELDFNYPVAHYALGVVYYNTDRTADAIQQLELAVRQMPNHYQALNLLGKIYLQEGDRNKAEKYLRQSLRVMPGQKDIESLLK